MIRYSRLKTFVLTTAWAILRGHGSLWPRCLLQQRLAQRYGEAARTLSETSGVWVGSPARKRSTPAERPYKSCSTVHASSLRRFTNSAGCGVPGDDDDGGAASASSVRSRLPPMPIVNSARGSICGQSAHALPLSADVGTFAFDTGNIAQSRTVAWVSLCLGEHSRWGRRHSARLRDRCTRRQSQNCHVGRKCAVRRKCMP